MVEPTALKNAYLVAGLSDDQIRQIAEIGTVRNFASGQAITRIGQSADEVFVILSGKLVVTSADGDRLGEVGVNSVVGEVGLVDAQPWSANATCNGPVATVVFPTSELRKLMAQNRDLGFVVLANISRVMSSRLRQMNARVDELSDLIVEPWDKAVG